MLLTNNNTRAIITLWGSIRAYDGYILQRYRVNIFNYKLNTPRAKILKGFILRNWLGGSLKNIKISKPYKNKMSIKFNLYTKSIKSIDFI